MIPPQQPGRDEPDVPKDTLQSTIILLATVADTTWRIFTPAVLFVGAGLWIDWQQGTKPWATFIGMIVGFVIATLLIRAQIKKIQR